MATAIGSDPKGHLNDTSPSKTAPTAMQLPELLAPAGSPDALEAAIEGGADAVYLGLDSFNARIGAHNFDGTALPAAIALAHAYGVRVYVTLNTQVLDREISDWLRAVELAYTSGADALIVADLGCAALAHRYFPELALHASTQMSGHNSTMTAELKTLGFSRMVIARETTLSDLRSVCAVSPIEIELFVHGALCVSQSGQCLFSYAVGGRSGNRGECAQPCRLPYNGRDRYPLSLKDLSLAGWVPELIESGVSSLKIEGRMKSPAYVYGVTRCWRRLLDERRAATPEELSELSELFSRGGFTDAYFRGKPDGSMLGIRSEGDKAASRAAAPFDGLRRRVPLDLTMTVRADTPVTLTATDDRARTVTVTGAVPERALQHATTTDALLPKLTRLGGTPYVARHTSIELEDGLLLPFSEVNALRRAAVERLALCERPQTIPLPDGINKQVLDALKRSVAGARPSVCPEVKTSSLPHRQAVCYQPEQLTEQVRAQFDCVYLPLAYFGEGEIAAPTDPRAKASAKHCTKELAWIPDGVLLPPILSEQEQGPARKKMQAARAAGVRYALLGNLSQLPLAQQTGLIPIGDLRLNICNAAGLAVAQAMGLHGTILSVELTLPRLRDLMSNFSTAVVYGRLPLMVLEKCVGLEAGGCERCQSGDTVLVDRMGIAFPVLRAMPHRSLIFNSVPTYMADKAELLTRYGIRNQVFLFTTETPEEVDRVIDAYRRALPPDGPVRRIAER